MTALQFALKVVRHCRARSAIFVLVGLATCLGLSAMLIAGNVKGHEYERRVSFVEAGASVWGHATINFTTATPFDRAIVDGTPRWFMIGTMFAVAFAALGGMLTRHR